MMLNRIGIRTSLLGRGTFARSFSSFRPVLQSSVRGANGTLNWVEFLKLKKEIGRLNFASSIFTAFLGSTLTWGYVGNLEIDVNEQIFGIDPFFVLGGVVVLGSGVGYLCGPLIGSSIFKLKNRAIFNEFKVKDKSWFERIRRNRVDPSSNSFSNPVPDYYGEKIYSLKDYRQWLRDCHAYRRKTQEFL